VTRTRPALVPAEKAAVVAAPLCVCLVGRGGDDPLALVAVSGGARVDLRVPVAAVGVGARYLTSVAASAAAAGWQGDEILALVSELERRTVQWVAANTVSSLLAGGRRRAVPGTRRAAMLVTGRWGAAACSPPEGDRLVRSAARRNAACLVAMSGAGHPAWAATSFVRWRAAGARGGVVAETGESAAIGARWAVNVVVSPRVSPSDLPGLREQLAAAPRCGWCHLPVLGAACERCVPEWDS
jgi:hypothetical protein